MTKQGCQEKIEDSYKKLRLSKKKLNKCVKKIKIV